MITVFGSFVVDLMARAPHFPCAGETVKGSLFRMGAGGKGFNQAVAAHKAGAEVVMSTKLGRDAFANVALQVMDELHMDKSRLFYSETEPTGAALITVDEQKGQNEIVIVSGACAAITDADVASLEETIAASEYVLLQLEVNQDANEKVARMAARHGVKVVLNTAPYQPVSDAFLAGLFMVTPNEVEAEGMTGVHIETAEDARRAAGVFHEKGVSQVVITLGRRGVFVSAEGRWEMIPAFAVNAIDTTGAGDAFNGGLLAALSEGKDVWEAARFANALAALSVQKLGTTPSMPARAEIDAFLRERASVERKGDKP